MAKNERKITTISVPGYMQALIGHIKDGVAYIPIVRKKSGMVVVELREADNGGAECESYRANNF